MERQDIISKINIELYGEKLTAQCRPEQTILGAMLTSDFDPPHSCKMGACGACRAKLIEGQVQMDEAVFLSNDEIAQGYILACQAIPSSPSCSIIFD